MLYAVYRAVTAARLPALDWALFWNFKTFELTNHASISCTSSPWWLN